MVALVAPSDVLWFGFGWPTLNFGKQNDGIWAGGSWGEHTNIFSPRRNQKYEIISKDRPSLGFYESVRLCGHGKIVLYMQQSLPDRPLAHASMEKIIGTHMH